MTNKVCFEARGRADSGHFSVFCKALLHKSKAERDDPTPDAATPSVKNAPDLLHGGSDIVWANSAVKPIGAKAQGSNTVQPVVARASRLVCAACTSVSGKRWSMRIFTCPLSTTANKSSAMAWVRSRLVM